MTNNGSLGQRFGLIILASSSPRRAKILSQIGFNFKVVPSTVEEVFNHHDPVEVSKDLALKKAAEIAERHPDNIVIGADTVVFLDKKILGKPVSDEDAYEMLRTLSAKTHEVYTAFAIVHKSTNKQMVDIERTEVTFRALSEEEIAEYVRSGEPMDKAGAYGIQDRSAVFVNKIVGDFYNVVGLPIARIYACLQNQF
jgi:septum formation protein